MSPAGERRCPGPARTRRARGRGGRRAAPGSSRRGCGPRCAGPCRRSAAGSSARHDAHGFDRRRRRCRRRRFARAGHGSPVGPRRGNGGRVGRRWTGLEDEAAVDRDRPLGQARRPLPLVDATTTVAPAAAAVRSSSSIRSRPSASSPAWGSSSSHSSGRRATSAARAVRRRWPAERRPTGGAGEAAGQPEPGQRGVDLRRAGAHGATPEADVLRDGQVLVQAVLVAEQAHAGPDGAAVDGQVDAEDGRLTPADRQQPRAQPQERRLARAVRSLQEDDLARERPRGWRPPGPGSGRAPRRRRGGGSPVP